MSPHWWVNDDEDICRDCLNSKDHPDHLRPLWDVQPPVKVGTDEKFTEAEIRNTDRLPPQLTLIHRSGISYTGSVQTVMKAEPVNPPNIWTINAGYSQLRGPWLLDWEPLLGLLP